MDIDRLIGKRFHEVSFPIPLQPFWKERIKETLHGGERHNPHPVKERRGQSLEERRHRLLAGFRRATVARDDRAGALAPVFARERSHGWNGLETHERAKLEWRLRQEVTIGCHDLASV